MSEINQTNRPLPYTGIPSATKRVPLDVDRVAVESLEVALQSILTSDDDDAAIGKIIEQNKKFPVPAFILRRTNIQLAQDFLNNYVMLKYGYNIGITKDKHHVITVFPTKVTYSMSVTLATDNFDIVDHWIKALMAYCRNELVLGHVELDDPVYRFQTRGKFTENYDYPPLTKGDNFTGFMHNVSLDLSTYICDLEYVPTIGTIIFDPVITPDIDSYNKFVNPVTKAGQFDPMQDLPAGVYTPQLRFTINLRDKIHNPALRD
jgi:hypothetical protein